MPKVKFYADTLRDSNKLFKFNTANERAAQETLERLKKALSITNIRAAWYCSRKEGINKRIV